MGQDMALILYRLIWDIGLVVIVTRLGKSNRTCHIGSAESIAAYIDRSYFVGFLFSRHRIILNRLDLITKTR